MVVIKKKLRLIALIYHIIMRYRVKNEKNKSSTIYEINIISEEKNMSSSRYDDQTTGIFCFKLARIIQ